VYIAYNILIKQHRYILV